VSNRPQVGVRQAKFGSTAFVFRFLKEIEMRRLFLLSGKRTALSIAVLGASALIAGTAGATSLPTFNAPGIPAPGYPDFLNSNNVTLVFEQITKKNSSVMGHSAPMGDYILAAAGTSGVFNFNSSASSNVNNEIFAMYAEFNSSGQFLSGGETIYGCQPPGTSCKFSQIQNLYTVSFDKYAASTSTIGLGFDTVYSTASGWAKQYESGNESLYLYAASMKGLDTALTQGGGKSLASFNGFSTTVSELTTVPLPAAGWLFGPAFAAMFGVMRRRRSDSAVLNTASA
jgi:hypothetical protein